MTMTKKRHRVIVRSVEIVMLDDDIERNALTMMTLIIIMKLWSFIFINVVDKILSRINLAQTNLIIIRYDFI